MSEANGTPSAAEAQELLAKAQSIGTSATSAASWPTAMTFTSLAIIGSMLMIGLHIVAHTGYGAPLLTISVAVWACLTAFIWPMFQLSTKAGYTKRFLTSLFVYFALYAAALTIGVLAFRNGSIAYYASAAAVLAAVGLAAAFRELRA
ncbi:hypothetical protein AL755_06360 [Arthrobacter sp. ERGS1:01]|uniref:hypothetical protein n=1 Tax=Arthrobacter sp. ERGS1:01 TaxID=1704044 RepID=UPI0006B5624D|nr:hypothetical protein [Arthrobacter sp. ERGS1:01]ALE05188.1 hypothetical protein AL755_06360 [Arthrobacter sp. ERGS1:01]